ncbi:sigma-70 family RNA polymerase sigma factor [Pigmentiphaga soli]|uniref:Sigma-70 family RNA polymerase sigma factor n=1 Tax=Pigmentiphaga soli TaxID=1007095 RepID=A0ABP8GZM0_9BURK
MADDARPVLVDYLARHYASLKLRVARLVGNADLAGDAMQDTWLRLQSRDADQAGAPIQSPASYLVRTAVNIAADIQRRQARSLPADEVEALKALADPAPGPEQVAAARADIGDLLKLVETMPARRREVFVLIHWEGMSQPEAARRLGVSLRTVEYELKYIHDHLNARMPR